MKDYIYILLMIVILVILIIGYPKKCSAGTSSSDKVVENKAPTNCNYEELLSIDDKLEICRKIPGGCEDDTEMERWLTSSQAVDGCKNTNVDESGTEATWNCKDFMKDNGVEGTDCVDYAITIKQKDQECECQGNDCLGTDEGNEPATITSDGKAFVNKSCWDRCQTPDGFGGCGANGTMWQETTLYDYTQGRNGGYLSPYLNYEEGQSITSPCTSDKCPGCCEINFGNTDNKPLFPQIYKDPNGNTVDVPFTDLVGWPLAAQNSIDVPGQENCGNKKASSWGEYPGGACKINNTRSVDVINTRLDELSTNSPPIDASKTLETITNAHLRKTDGNYPDRWNYLQDVNDLCQIHSRAGSEDSYTSDYDPTLANSDVSCLFVESDGVVGDDQPNGVCIPYKWLNVDEGVDTGKTYDNDFDGTVWSGEAVARAKYTRTDGTDGTGGLSNIYYMDGSNHLTIDMLDKPNCASATNATDCAGVEIEEKLEKSNGCKWVPVGDCAANKINNLKSPGNSQYEATKICRNVSAWNKLIDFSYTQNEGVCHSPNEVLTMEGGVWNREDIGGLFVSYSPVPNADINIPGDQSNYEWSWKYKEIIHDLSKLIADKLTDNVPENTPHELDGDNYTINQIGTGPGSAIEQVNPEINIDDGEIIPTVMNSHGYFIPGFSITLTEGTKKEEAVEELKIKLSSLTVDVPAGDVPAGDEKKISLNVSVGGDLDNISLSQKDPPDDNVYVVNMEDVAVKTKCDALNGYGNFNTTVLDDETNLVDYRIQNTDTGFYNVVVGGDRRNCLINGQSLTHITSLDADGNKTNNDTIGTSGCVWTPARKDMTKPIIDISEIFDGKRDPTDEQTYWEEFVSAYDNEHDGQNCKGWDKDENGEDEKSNFQYLQIQDGGTITPGIYNQYINSKKLVVSSPAADTANNSSQWDKAFAADSHILKSIGQKTAIQCFTPDKEDGDLGWSPTANTNENANWDQTCINVNDPLESYNDGNDGNDGNCGSYNKGNKISNCSNGTIYYSGEWDEITNDTTNPRNYICSNCITVESADGTQDQTCPTYYIDSADKNKKFCDLNSVDCDGHIENTFISATECNETWGKTFCSKPADQNT